MTYSSNLALAIENIFQIYPDNIALSYSESDHTVSYRELGGLVNAIAQYLYVKGLRQDDVLVIANDKSPYGFASVLACLRLGIIYVNLDINSPWGRVTKIIQNCKAKFVLNTYEDTNKVTNTWSSCDCVVLNVRSCGKQDVKVQLPDPSKIAGNAPAYIMYTSGSTGVPKGAVMSHANLLWFIQWSQCRFGITSSDILTNVNPIYFDNSVFDFFSAIFSGACLAPFTYEQTQNTRNLVKLVDKAKCTIWFSVPSLLIYLLTTRALNRDDFSFVRKIIFGGEGFPKTKLKQLYDLFGQRADLENVYGPTECTCICSAYTIEADDFNDMQSLAPLGNLAQNFDFELLPTEENNVESTTGELFLLGPQVGLGYYNDVERTHRLFHQNPKQNNYIEIGYRTGDLVQLDQKGYLHFKGRVDFQIKHMGYRIELEEIEAAISTIPEIDECAVVYRKDLHGFGQILAAWSGVENKTSEQDLILAITKILPTYMIPKRAIYFSTLPKNANGKIDRLRIASLIPQ